MKAFRDMPTFIQHTASVPQLICPITNHTWLVPHLTANHISSYQMNIKPYVLKVVSAISCY